MSDSTLKTSPTLEQWSCLELMGHVRLYGRVSEEEHFGQKVGRIDVPTGDGPDEYVTQFFGGASLYRITPCTEDLAREQAGYRPRRLGVYTGPPRFGHPEDAGVRFDEDDDDDDQDGIEEGMREEFHEGDVRPEEIPF